jgi:hypothetical protein
LEQLDLHSTGRRNSLIEYVCWTSKVKRLARTLVLSAIVGVSAVHFVLTVRFWFYIPIVGIGLATACFAGALGYTLLGG